MSDCRYWVPVFIGTCGPSWLTMLVFSLYHNFWIVIVSLVLYAIIDAVQDVTYPNVTSSVLEVGRI